MDSDSAASLTAFVSGLSSVCRVNPSSTWSPSRSFSSQTPAVCSTSQSAGVGHVRNRSAAPARSASARAARARARRTRTMYVVVSYLLRLSRASSRSSSASSTWSRSCSTSARWRAELRRSLLLELVAAEEHEGHSVDLRAPAPSSAGCCARDARGSSADQTAMTRNDRKSQVRLTVTPGVTIASEHRVTPGDPTGMDSAFPGPCDECIAPGIMRRRSPVAMRLAAFFPTLSYGRTVRSRASSTSAARLRDFL